MKETRATSIAICIPSYNCGRYLRTTIESALSQTSPADEIIVSDDHSTDNSKAILADYAGDARLRIIGPEQRLTLGGHYRFLLEQANSDFVTFLSADDVMLPSFVAEARRAIDAASDTRLVIGACVAADSALKALHTRGTRPRASVLSYPGSFDYMLGGTLYTVSFSAMHRERLLAAPAPPASVDVAIDWYWALWLTSAGGVVFVPRPLGYYRVHDANAGHDNPRYYAALEPMLRFLAPQLPAREQAAVLARIEVMSAAVSDAGPAPRDRLEPLKRLAKRLQALPYRRLPANLRLAERG